MRLLSSKKGQSTLEFTMIVVIVITALGCMFTYVKRGVQGRFKTGADAISMRQYEPGKTLITGR